MKKSNVTHHIMVVDDEVNVLKALRRELENNKLYRIHAFKSPEAALLYAETHRMDLLINADEAQRHSHYNEVKIPVMLSKPWHSAELLQQVASALSHHSDQQS